MVAYGLCGLSARPTCVNSAGIIHLMQTVEYSIRNDNDHVDINKRNVYSHEQHDITYCVLMTNCVIGQTLS